MRKIAILTVCSVLILSGCGTYTGSGAYVGAQFGTVLGSAIGGLTDGWYGHNMGAIIGMAGGAAVGAAIGSAADKADREERHQHYENVQRRKAQDNRSAGYENRNVERQYDDSRYYDPTNSGDDRLYDFSSSDYTSDYSAANARTLDPGSSSIEDISSNYKVNTAIEIRNPRFVDNNRDGLMVSNEICKVIFEVYNTSNSMLYDLQPMVVESSGAKNIYISPSVHVEQLAPGKGIRYTAMVKSGKLKNGTANFCLSVLQGERVMSNVSEFSIETRK